MTHVLCALHGHCMLYINRLSLSRCVAVVYCFVYVCMSWDDLQMFCMLLAVGEMLWDSLYIGVLLSKDKYGVQSTFTSSIMDFTISTREAMSIKEQVASPPTPI